MSLLGRNTLWLASAIRLSMASTSVAVPKFASFVQVEQPKRTMANWINWLPDNVKGFEFSKQGYNQYGLYHDDLYIEDEEDVQEALRQLPPQHLDERAFRAQRALHYAMLRTVLPKEGLGLLRGRQEERILFEALL